MNCKNCGKELREGAAFCSFCGTEVEKNQHCLYCGNEIDNEAAFCSHCGIPIKKDEAPKTVVENSEPELTDESESKENVVYISDSKNNLNKFTLVFAVLSFIMSCINTFMIYYY